MFQKTSTKVFGLMAAGLTLAVMAACGPAPTQGTGNPVTLSLSGISVSEITPQGTSKTTISLGWGDVPAGTSSIKLFRREEGQTQDQVQNIAAISPVDRSKTTFTDEDTSLNAGTKYVYNLRADNANAIALGSATSKAVDVISANDIKSFALTRPDNNDQVLRDPTGQGVEFTWADAGTGLYYVQVKNLGGQVLWGAVTKNTSMVYGTQSGAASKGASVDSKLIVPRSLGSKLVISSTNPDAGRGEVMYQGIGNNTQYRVQVSAIETRPNKADLAGATALAIRPAAEIRFYAQ